MENRHRPDLLKATQEWSRRRAVLVAVRDLFKHVPGSENIFEVASVLAKQGHPLAIELMAEFEHDPEIDLQALIDRLVHNRLETT